MTQKEDRIFEFSSFKNFGKFFCVNVLNVWTLRGRSRFSLEPCGFTRFTRKTRFLRIHIYKFIDLLKKKNFSIYIYF